MNPYEVLGLKKDCNKKQIKNAYRKLSKIHHPDTGGDQQKFIEVQRAYDILSDEVARKKYDELQTELKKVTKSDIKKYQKAIENKLNELFGK